jgi:hypothetical protein
VNKNGSMNNVLKNKVPSENIIKLRELTLKMERMSHEDSQVYDILNEISSILSKEEHFSCDNEKIMFYEKLYNHIRRLLNSIKI